MPSSEQKPGIASPSAGPRERVEAFCERAILWLTLAVVVLGPLGLGAVRPQEFLILQFLTAAILILWLVRYWFGRAHRLLWPPICWAVLAFVAYAVARYFTADLEYVARQELVRVILYAALFLAVLTNCHRQEATRVLTLTLIGLGTLLSLYAVYQWITDSEYVWWFLKPRCYFRRASGSYICPNHFAGFLGMLMPIALSYTITGRFNPIPRILLGYAALVMMAGIAVTTSRGAWAASGLGLVIFFVCLLRQRPYRLIATVCLVLIGLGTAAFYFKSARTQERIEDTRLTGYDRNLRLRIWTDAWKMWRDHPWAGVGPGHFDYRYRQYRDFHDKLQSRPGRVHNDYLNTLVDWGVIGFVLVALAWAALFWGVVWGWRFIHRRGNDLGLKKSNKSAFVLGASIGLITLLAHSFVDFNMHIPANASTAVTLMALITGHLRFASDRFWVARRTSLWAATVVLAGGILFLIGTGGRFAREQYWLRQAARLQGDLPGEAAALRKAFAIEPRNFDTAHAIGENLRQQSWRAEPGWEKLATEAITWFERAAALNPFDGYNPMRIGMCLHWLGRHAEAGPWFDKAYRLDPHGYFMLLHLGWHYFQLEQYEEAAKWLWKSYGLNPHNQATLTYIELVRDRLNEQKALQQKAARKP